MQTNWNHLHHAYGLATDTPNHLQNLLSPNFDLRDDAVNHLFSAVVHQNTTYPVTPVVVQALLGLLHEPALRENMRDFYNQQYKIGIAWRNKEIADSNTHEIMRNARISQRDELEKALNATHPIEVLDYIISFLGYVGDNLLYTDVLTEISRPSEEEITNLYNSYSKKDEHGFSKEFYQSPLEAILLEIAVYDVFSMAGDVINALQPLTSDANFNIAKEAASVIEVWKKNAIKFSE